MTEASAEHRATHGDVSLVDRARDGDPDAWRALYDAHAGRLLLWLRQLPTGDPAADHDDLAMEAWTLAASHIADFKGSDDDFAGWLFIVARNHQLNARRKAGRRRTYATDSLPEQAVSGDSVTAEYESGEVVRQALASLPPREGEVLTCVEVVGLDVETTARILGIGRPAVRIARRRGLARLRAAGWKV